MKRIMYIGAASLALLFLSVGHAAAQPSSEETVNVWADSLDSTNQMDVAVYTVPPGKKLIIDNVSLRTRVPAGEQVIGANMNLPYVHFFVVADQGVNGNDRYFAAGQRTQIVVEANQTIVFRIVRNNYGTPAYTTVALAGRLIKN